jgi:hypothetical protein
MPRVPAAGKAPKAAKAASTNAAARAQAKQARQAARAQEQQARAARATRVAGNKAGRAAKAQQQHANRAARAARGAADRAARAAQHARAQQGGFNPGRNFHHENPRPDNAGLQAQLGQGQAGAAAGQPGNDHLGQAAPAAQPGNDHLVVGVPVGNELVQGVPIQDNPAPAGSQEPGGFEQGQPHQGTDVQAPDNVSLPEAPSPLDGITGPDTGGGDRWIAPKVSDQIAGDFQ